MSAPSPESGIVPAQVGFLAIYNPSLGPSDDSIADQIVYYASVKGRSNQSGRPRRRRRAREPETDFTRQERNEQLRQIGLAQAMVGFGNTFSDGQPVDRIETEKSRIVLHELEPGWWILAVRLVSAPSQLPLGSSRGGCPC